MLTLPVPEIWVMNPPTYECQKKMSKRISQDEGSNLGIFSIMIFTAIEYRFF